MILKLVNTFSQCSSIFRIMAGRKLLILNFDGNMFEVTGWSGDMMISERVINILFSIFYSKWHTYFYSALMITLLEDIVKYYCFNSLIFKN